MPTLVNVNGTIDPDAVLDTGLSPNNPIRANIIFNQSDSYSLDHVNISRDLYFHLYTSSYRDGDTFASIKLIEETNSEIFRTFRIHLKEELHLNTVEFNNMTNLMHFKSQITINSCLVIGTPKPLKLSSMVISFPPEVFELVSLVSNDKLFMVMNEGGNRIFRKNDLVRNLNGKVIQCEPIDQGFISEETKITAVKSEHKQLYQEPKISKVDILENINYNFKNYLSFEEDNLQSQHTELKTESLKSQIDVFSPILNHTDDNEVYGFVKVNELSKIGCFSGDIVEVLIGGNVRYIKVFSFSEPNDFRPGTIYLSPVYLINLGSPKSLKVSPTIHKDPIAIAKKVTIARISSPVSLNRAFQHLFLSNLKNHFENKKRLIFKDQIIHIPLDSILASSLLTDDSGDLPEIIPEGNCDLIAWFKVTEINDGADNGDQYIIDSTHTKMVQSGIVSQQLPDNSLGYYQYLGLGDLFPFKTESGDFPYAQTFRKLLKTTRLGPSLRTSILLHSQTRGIGKSLLVENTAIELGLHFVELNGYEFLNPGSEMKIVGLIRGKLDRIAQNCSSVVIYFKNIEALTKKKDQQGSGKQDSLILKLSELIDEYLNLGVIVVASTNDLDNISDSFRSKFKFEINFNVPSQSERYEIFKFYLKNMSDSLHIFKLREDVSITALSLKSAGLTPRDLMSIVNAAKDLSLESLEEVALNEKLSFKTLYYLNGGYINLLPSSFEKAINDARSKFSDSIGAPKIPNVKWADVGGLDLVKDEILDTIDMPLKHPELFANGLKKRSGILFYGPPGTGKTLLAKAIATNFSLNFFSVKGPELLNMYIGESEANVRKVFQKARDSKPCVVFFDELDSVAPKRGNQGDSGGVMDRIVSQLLAELDGMSSNGGDGVFVVGATNRPDLLDDALLRPGRFDKMLYLGISDTDEKQLKILQALTRNFKLDDNLDLMKVARSCAFNFTGADFYALCSDSILNSMIRLSTYIDNRINEINKTAKDKINTRYFFEKLATPEDIDVVVTEQDFEKALSSLTPSVSQEELNHYLNIKKSFERG